MTNEPSYRKRALYQGPEAMVLLTISAICEVSLSKRVRALGQAAEHERNREAIEIAWRAHRAIANYLEVAESLDRLDLPAGGSGVLVEDGRSVRAGPHRSYLRIRENRGQLTAETRRRMEIAESVDAAEGDLVRLRAALTDERRRARWHYSRYTHKALAKLLREDER